MTEEIETDNKPRGRGPGRTTREDWIQIALDTLISEGVDSVKVLMLAQKLDCARSSFYWYFKNRTDLLDSLLNYWQITNTRALVTSANKVTDTVNEALINVFACWNSGGEFDTRLDFAIRDWARRSGTVRRVVDISDSARIEALVGMFLRFGYAQSEAEVRARIIYFTQIGYDALDQRESSEIRRSRAEDTLFCMTGAHPTEAEVNKLKAMPLAMSQ